ncbi:MAG: hypothetical protein L0323_20070 [Planctomycetes bacterium]|nr:hypothetical protein [Planctomycetota bacterium]
MRTLLGPPSGVRLLGLAALFLACPSVPAAKATASGQTPAAPGKSAKISSESTATAEVVAVGKELRLVTLRREDGRLLEVVCGPEVRNFDKINVGDTLRARYQESLTASLCAPGEKPGPVVGAVTGARAKKGERPAGAAGIAVSLRVKIESIDLPHDIVVFSPASGDLIAHRIATPEGREFVKGLKVGDVVRLDYAEVLALSLETAP